MQGFDNDLIHSFNEGEEKAFNEVYKLYYRLLCYYAQRLSLSREDSEDVVSATFVSLFQEVRKGKRFDDLSHIKNFLFLATRNAGINRTRHLQRQAGYAKDFVRFAKEDDDEEDRNQRVEAEMLHMIYQAVENLPAECRKIFKMKYLEDLSYQEIATELNLSPQTVRNQKSRAIVLLRKYILKPQVLALAALSVSSLLPGFVLVSFLTIAGG